MKITSTLSANLKVRGWVVILLRLAIKLPRSKLTKRLVEFLLDKSIKIEF